MKLKEIDRTVHVAWSPVSTQEYKSKANYLIAGTAAQQLDASFSTNSQLELFQVNLADRSTSMISVGSIKTDYRFNKLIWPSSQLLIGATEKGHIYLVDPFAQSITQQLDKHCGNVQSIDMNVLQPNLFASGGSNSELMIWDLNDLKQPMIPGGASSTTHHADEDVQCVAWNRQKSHILGSTLGGKTLIWDLKSSNEPIFKISDSTYRMRANRLIWHPEITSQLCLASEEDQSAAIQLWDLRYGASPLKLLNGHTRGILDLQWSPNDGNLIMSSGKDNKIICWNPNDVSVAAEIVYEIPCNHWCFDIKWCLVDPNLISASSFDGTLSVYTLMGGSCQLSRPVNNQLFTQAFGDVGITSNDTVPSTTTHDVTPIKYAPKWMRRQARVSFAFGGKLVVVQAPASATISDSCSVSPNVTTHRRPPVIIQQLVVDQAFVQAVQTFDEMLQAGTVLEYCDRHISSANNSQDEQILWRFLRASFEPDPKQHYIELLGFHRDDIVHRAQTLTRDDQQQLPIEAMNGLHVGEHQTKKTTTADVDILVNRCIMLGQFQVAVELCLSAQRYAEAFFLAQLGGQELLLSTQKRYLEKVQTSSTKLIDIVLHQDWKRLIESSNISNWRDVLVTLLTYTNGTTFTDLCNQLGHRLSQQNITTNDSIRAYTSICFVCSGNLEQFDLAWSSKFQRQEISPMELQRLIEKLFILKRSLDYVYAQQKKTAVTSTSMDGQSISHHLAMFGQLLANEGCARTALLYLGNLQTPELILLRDRLYHGLPSSQVAGIPKPPSPFRRVDIPSPQKQQQQPRQPVSTISQHFRPSAVVEQPFAQPPPPTWPSSQTAPNDLNPRLPAAPLTNRYSTPAATPTPAIPTYQAPLYNPTMPTNQHYNPTSVIANAQYVHGNTTAVIQSTDPSNASSVPPPTFVPSYQDAKPANAWNDPPTVTMKVPKSNPTKTPITGSDGVPATSSAFTPSAGAAEVSPTSFHFNPTINQQTTSAIYPPSGGSDFLHHPHSQPMAQDSSTRTAPTPPPPPAPIVKGPLPTEHQIIQDTFDLLANRCQQATQQLPLKRRLDEVKKKLDFLYDKLRENKVPGSVSHGIHQIIVYIRQYDYQTSLSIYNQMVATENLAETSQYMPAVKTLIQYCIQLNVFCQQ